jgi:hypothetical protein
VIAKLRGQLTGDDRVVAQFFLGKDVDHLKHSGELVLDIEEWQLLGAILLLGSARTEGAIHPGCRGVEVLVEDPVAAAGKGTDPTRLAESLEFLSTLGWQDSAPQNPAHIPPELRASLDRYANEGVPVGGFLQAVIANDLCDAYARADAFNVKLLPAIGSYVHHKMPADCWGSRKIYRTWLAVHAARRAIDRARVEEDAHSQSALARTALDSALANEERARAELKRACHEAREQRRLVE